MTTRDEALDAAAEIFARAWVARDRLSPRNAAEAAWYIGHPLKTVDAIEALIVRRRAAAARPATPAIELPAAA